MKQAKADPIRPTTDEMLTMDKIVWIPMGINNHVF